MGVYGRNSRFGAIDDPSMKNILVTGGAGYIGSHVCKALAKVGMTPVVFDNLSTGHWEAAKWGKVVLGDLLLSHIPSILLTHKIDAVIHCAGVTSVAESMTDPGKYFQYNVVGTVNLLDAMVSCGVTHLVSSSSAAVYGGYSGPLFEQNYLSPMNPYGRSKLIVENMLAWYPLRSVSLRYFNVAGADPEDEIGEDHDPETHLIPNLIGSCLKGAPVKVFGNDHPTIDGTAVRDYVHVTDVADANVRALEFLDRQKNIGHRAFNVCTGTPTSVRDALRMVQDVTRRLGPVDTEPRRPGDPPVLTGSPQRAADELGWQPTRSLRVMVEDAARWARRSR